jgi:hypothetical protein
MCDETKGRIWASGLPVSFTTIMARGKDQCLMPVRLRIGLFALVWRNDAYPEYALLPITGKCNEVQLSKFAVVS